MSFKSNKPRFEWRRLGEQDKKNPQHGQFDTRTWALYKYGSCLATITYTDVVPLEKRVKGQPTYKGLSIRIVPHLGYKAHTYLIKVVPNPLMVNTPPNYKYWKGHTIKLVKEIIDNRGGSTKDRFKALGWDRMLKGKLPLIL